MKPVRTEPVALGGILQIVVTLAAGFGLELTVEQLTAVISLTQVLITFFQRRAVTPSNS